MIVTKDVIISLFSCFAVTVLCQMALIQGSYLDRVGVVYLCYMIHSISGAMASSAFRFAPFVTAG